MKKLIYVFVVASLIGIFVGCDSKKKTYDFKPIEKSEAIDFITYSNSIKPLACIRMNDKEYAIPTVQWIKDVFTPAYKDFLFKNNLRTARDSMNDCDKFTLHARSVGNVLYSKETKRINGAALAIGEYQYLYGLDAHDIIYFFAYDETGTLVMVFYEPMIQSIIIFEPRDATCMYLTL